MSDSRSAERETLQERLLAIIESMRAEGPRYKSHDLGFVDSVSSSRVDEWADELEQVAAALAPPVEGSEPSAYDIATANIRQLLEENLRLKKQAEDDRANYLALKEGSEPSLRERPTRFAWLLERRLTKASGDLRGLPAGTLVYWDGGHAESFTTDPYKAVQWPSRQEAERTCPPEHYAQWGWDYVEHGFMGPEPSLRERWQPIETAPDGYDRERQRFNHVLFRGTSRGGSFAGYAYVSGWMANDRKPVYSYSYKLDITDWMPIPGQG